MTPYLKNISLLTFLLCFLGTQAQTVKSEFDIDPRQYIEITEVRNFKKKIPLYSWKDFELSNQDRRIVDENSVIRIDFKKDSLAKAIKFKGNIYVQATLVGDGGSENPVEVLPYTKIGEDKAQIGIPTRPAEEIAQIFLNMLQQSLELKTKYNGYRGIEENLASSFNSKGSSLRTLEYNELINTFETLNLVLQYISFFKESGEQAEDAFLSLIGLDYLSLDQTQNLLTDDYNKVDSLLKKRSADVEGAILAAFDHAYNILDKLTSLEGTTTNEIMGELLNKETNLIKDLFGGEITNDPDSTQYIFNSNGVVAINSQTKEDLAYLSFDSKIYQIIIQNLKPKLIMEIAALASANIYIDLNFATIDLLKEGGDANDILYINLILTSKDRRSKNEISSVREKVYPIGRYKLQKTGWKANVTDSFFLMDRIDEPGSSTSNVSPSNFKGAPGVTLNATLFGNGDPKNWLINFLRPSIGLDVSYVDFDTQKDIEIGAGLVVGLFNNRVFATYGINLNHTGEGEQAPNYFGIGFSFAKLGEKLLKD